MTSAPVPSLTDDELLEIDSAETPQPDKNLDTLEEAVIAMMIAADADVCAGCGQCYCLFACRPSGATGCGTDSG